MNCIVTAGPTCEPLDEVRRLTNISTGALGSKLANYLVAHGHTVTLLLGQSATHRDRQQAQAVLSFGTTAELHDRLQTLASPRIQAVFHVAAVSDFAFGKIWERSAGGALRECRAAKIATRSGTLLAELVPTPKIINALRSWFPSARLVGWKYELDGDRSSVLRKAEGQLAEARTDACVANGRAYGAGFGLVTGPERPAHFDDSEALFAALEKLIHPPEQRGSAVG